MPLPSRLSLLNIGNTENGILDAIHANPDQPPIAPIIPEGKTVDEQLRSFAQHPMYNDPNDRSLFDHVTKEYQRAYPGNVQYDEFGKMLKPEPAISAADIQPFDPNGILGNSEFITLEKNLDTKPLHPEHAIVRGNGPDITDAIPLSSEGGGNTAGGDNSSDNSGDSDDGGEIGPGTGRGDFKTQTKASSKKTEPKNCFAWALRPKLQKNNMGTAKDYDPSADPEGDFSYLDEEKGTFTDEQLNTYKDNAHLIKQHADAINIQGQELLPSMTNGNPKSFQNSINHIDDLEKIDPESYKNLPFETIVLHQTYKQSLGENPTPKDMQNAYRNAMNMGALQYADDGVRSALMQAYHEAKAGIPFVDVDLKQIAEDTRINTEQGYQKSDTINAAKSMTDMAVGIGSKFIPYGGGVVLSAARGIGQARIQGAKEGWKTSEIAEAALLNAATGLIGGKAVSGTLKKAGLATTGKYAAKSFKKRFAGAAIDLANDKVYEDAAKNITVKIRTPRNRPKAQSQ